MRKIYLILFFIIARSIAYTQGCSTTTLDATACRCKDTSQLNCDLLPDLTVSYDALDDTSAYTEYPQLGIGANDGRLLLTAAIPNIGVGPFELHGTNFFQCGNDTMVGNPGICPDGSQPKQLTVQYIYHKNNDSMSFYSRMTGFVTYHPLHSHFHVDNWAYYTLRIKIPGEPNALLWPIIGEATKNGYCLQDDGTCSTNPGYCRDSSNNILLDSNFKNMSMVGYFSCTPVVQGITPGYFDIYEKDDYGMWIDIPTGTCNGNYYIVIDVDPLNLFTEISKTNNWIAVPITLTKQDSAGNPQAVIYPQGFTTICQGDSLNLTATGGYSFLWSTGDTVQTITVKTAGTYSVKVNSPCGIATSAPINITVLNAPNSPSVTVDTICVGDSAKLKATGADSLNWYASSAGGSILHTGSPFVTPPLSSSKIYYVEDAKTIPGVTLSGGLPDSAAKGHYYAAKDFASTLFFECVSAFTLNAVTVYANDSGMAIVSLFDWDGHPLKRDTVKVIKGKNRIPLNFKVFSGNNYYLGLLGDSIFYGDSANIKYPYDIPGVLSIKKSSISKRDYLFFYNWEITTNDLVCRSPRVAVNAIVNACTGVRDIEIIQSHIKVYPNPFNTYTIVSVDKNYLEFPYSFVLYDILGSPVFKKESITSDSFQIDRNDLSSGVYIYKLYLKNNLVITGKLVTL